jgi:hypothetical protein
MARQDVLGELDFKRAEIVQKWQARVRDNPELDYEVRSPSQSLPGFHVSQETDYRIGEIVPWVAAEKYLSGEIMNWGGVQKPNIHLRLDRSGKTILVGTSQNLIRNQSENLVYHKALLHVRAEEHFQTGELRNVHLLSIVDYKPAYDEKSLERFAAKGETAWADVPDAAGWVKELRGGMMHG